jgi:hypothetical protein
MMSIVDSISSIAMDTPIATIFMFDWTTDVIESVIEVVVVLRDMEEEFVVAKSDIKLLVGSNPIKFNIAYIMQHAIIYDILLQYLFRLLKFHFV